MRPGCFARQLTVSARGDGLKAQHAAAGCSFNNKCIMDFAMHQANVLFNAWTFHDNPLATENTVVLKTIECRLISENRLPGCPELLSKGSIGH